MRLTVVAALVVAYALKAFYSRAGFEDLRWILSPTVALLSGITGVRFVPEPHVGYVSRDLLYAVVPACAGVNFLIAAFLSLVVGLIGRCRAMPGRILLVPGSVALAYVTTILANTTRLAIAIPLHRSGVAPGALTPERIHHVEGTIVYFAFLFVMFVAAVRWSEHGAAA